MKLIIYTADISLLNFGKRSINLNLQTIQQQNASVRCHRSPNKSKTGNVFFLLTFQWNDCSSLIVITHCVKSMHRIFQ